MRAEPLGDCAYILRELEMPAYELADDLNARSLPGLIEAVASYDTVGVYVDPDSFELRELLIIAPRKNAMTPPKSHRIPVCYRLGSDTQEVCNKLNLTERALAETHASTSYRCYAVGFCPGFAYLGYLPPALSGMPRRASPRTLVDPGSVAITGNQTAVYPLERPGGWALLGKTPLCLVDVEERYFPIQAGDEVSFFAIDENEYAARLGERL